MDIKKYRLGEVCTIIPGYAAFERVTTPQIRTNVQQV